MPLVYFSRKVRKERKGFAIVPYLRRDGGYGIMCAMKSPTPYWRSAADSENSIAQDARRMRVCAPFMMLGLSFRVFNH